MVKLNVRYKLVSPKDTVIVEDKVFVEHHGTLVFYRSLLNRMSRLVAIEEDKFVDRISKQKELL